MVGVRERPSAADGDEARVADLGQDHGHLTPERIRPTELSRPAEDFIVRIGVFPDVPGYADGQDLSMTLISFLIAILVGLLSYSIGYNTYRIRRKQPAMVRRSETQKPLSSSRRGI
jgi:hypothetical protein